MRERTQDLELINFIGDSPSMALTDFRLSPDQSNGGFIVILADDGKTRAITHVAREAVERMLGDYDSRLSRSERDRAARYREQVERFREIAKMETQPRVRARLLELAEQYDQLGTIWSVKRREDPEGHRPRSASAIASPAARLHPLGETDPAASGAAENV